MKNAPRDEMQMRLVDAKGVKATLRKGFPRMSQSYMTDRRMIGLGVLTKKICRQKRERFAFLCVSLVVDCVNLRID